MSATILVVDDDPVALRMLEEAVKAGGYEVLRAYGAEDALRKVKLRRPDLVLTDLEMPKVNGVALIASIRADAEIRHTPIIAVTSYACDTMGQAAAQVGCDGNIAKPFLPKQLLLKVREFLATRHPAPELHMPRPLTALRPAPPPAAVGPAAAAPTPSTGAGAVEGSTIFERATFLEYVDGNLEHAQRTIEVLLRTLPERLAVMRQAVAGGDRDTLRQSAHALKGSLAFFAAPAVVAAAFRLEMMGHAGDLSGAGAQYFELERALDRLVVALNEFVREVGGAPDAAKAAPTPVPGLHLVRNG
jgi:CheY-like chemotaxis protein/HPt (histidine-containing phosphotransfer) domain-containing protein